nr:DUF6300 family protein [Streptomyces sp. BA2]
MTAQVSRSWVGCHVQSKGAGHGTAQVRRPTAAVFTRGDLILSGVAPQNDEQGRPIHLELCPICDTGDADRPAAGMFVQWFADGGGH